MVFICCSAVASPSSAEEEKNNFKASTAVSSDAFLVVIITGVEELLLIFLRSFSAPAFGKSTSKITSEYLIDLCIELVGQSNITSKTKNDLVEYSKQFEGENLKNHLDETIIKLIQIIVSTKEYQFS